MAAPGSYVLVVNCTQPVTIEVGALGEIGFNAGTYAYVGSAFGPGGLARVERHRRVANGEHDVRHWHIDYLLGSTETQLKRVETFRDRDLECTLASAFAEAACQPVNSFGASDCDCVSHLWALGSSTELPETVAAYIE